MLGHFGNASEVEIWDNFKGNWGPTGKLGDFVQMKCDFPHKMYMGINAQSFWTVKKTNWWWNDPWHQLCGAFLHPIPHKEDAPKLGPQSKWKPHSTSWWTHYLFLVFKWILHATVGCLITLPWNSVPFPARRACILIKLGGGLRKPKKMCPYMPKTQISPKKTDATW